MSRIRPGKAHLLQQEQLPPQEFFPRVASLYTLWMATASMPATIALTKTVPLFSINQSNMQESSVRPIARLRPGRRPF
jgi:hypothetical protein